MKRFFVFLLVLFLFIGNGCVTSKNTYYHKKTQTVKGKDYKANRGLMLLDQKQLGINKYYYSKNNQKRIHKKIGKK